MKKRIIRLYNMYKSSLHGSYDEDIECDMEVERLSKVEKELLKAFPECKDLLNKYRSAYIDFNMSYNRNEFRKGFLAGAKMIIEIISGDK